MAAVALGRDATHAPMGQRHPLHNRGTKGQGHEAQDESMSLCVQPTQAQLRPGKAGTPLRQLAVGAKWTQPSPAGRLAGASLALGWPEVPLV